MFELVRSPDFANLPLIVEDFVKDNGGSYTGEFAGAFSLQLFSSVVVITVFDWK